MLILHTTSPAASENTHGMQAAAARPGVWKVGHGLAGGERERGRGPDPAAFLHSSAPPGHRMTVPGAPVTRSTVAGPGEGLAPPCSRRKHSTEPRGCPPAERGSAGCQPPHLPQEVAARAGTCRRGWALGGAHPPPARAAAEGSEGALVCPEAPPRTSEMRRISENKPMGSITHKTTTTKRRFKMWGT